MHTPFTVITGASRGLGAAFAAALAAQHKPLFLVARSRDSLTALADRLRAEHRVAVTTLVCDLAQPDGVQALVDGLQQTPVELLINNAGVGLGGAFVEHEAADIAAMLYLNVVSLTRLCHALLPKLQATQGAIMNLASQAAFQPMPYLAAYAASKAYVLQFSEALQYELAPLGVHVIAVCPGATATDFFDAGQMDLQKTSLKLGPIAPVIDAALAALAQRHVVVVPGWKNWLATWGVRLLSRRQVTQLTGRLVRPDAHRRQGASKLS